MSYQTKSMIGKIINFSIIISVLSIIICLIVFLNQFGVFVPIWRNSPLKDIRPEIGNAYVAATHHQELSSHKHPSIAKVMEDGKTLSGPANSYHDDIRSKGNGRYSFWFDVVYFSTSDNSDPRNNGRVYIIRYPFIIGYKLAAFFYTLMIISWGLSIILIRKHPDLNESESIFAFLKFLRNFFSKNTFKISSLMLFAIFVITRLPFFLHFPVVNIYPDSQSYSEIVQTINSGEWPLFNMRTPGYPIFIKAVTYISDTWLAVVYAQNFLMFCSCLFLLYSIYKLRRSLTFFGTIAIIGFIGSSQILIYDMSALSESLYTSLTILSFAFLISSFARQSTFNFVMTSITMALTILVRPAGMYLIVIYLIVILFMFWNRYPKILIAQFFFPLPIILITLSFYNLMTLNIFSISPWGSVNIAHATILFWEPDKSFDKEVNEVLEKLPLFLIDKIGFSIEEKNVLDKSWDLNKLNSIFQKGFTGYLYPYTTGDIFKKKSSKNNESAATEYSNSIVKRICYKSIVNHPDIYFKFILSNVKMYFDNVKYRFYYYQSIIKMAEVLYINKYYSSNGPNKKYSFIAKEFADSLPPIAIKISEGDDHKIILGDSSFKKIHQIWQSVQFSIYQSIFWVVAYLVVLLSSILQLIRFKGRHIGSFILFIQTLSVVGALLIVCLVEIALERYAYPTQFIYYLAPALFPILWIKNEDLIKNK